MTVSSARPGLSTRDLLICSAISVVTAAVLIPALWLQATLAVALPALYAVFAGSTLFGPVLAQALLRRAGVALATAVISALAVMPANPRGAAVLLPVVAVGLAFEAVFAITGYRRWPSWRWLAVGAVLGVVQSLAVWAALDLGALAPALAGATVALVIASYVGWPAAALVLRRQLYDAGVGVSVA
ncbi:ECF transporter S component [Nocardioides sp.]|uniref:ECF transporter S component n=1 Tax=Nocardioides sp. TaxID=35761 RepID=UPI0039E641A5